jgi:ATP-binding cassette subfamily B protein
MRYLKRLLPFLKPYRGSLGLLALWTIGGIACGMLQPYQLSLVVDEGIAKMDMAAVTRYCLMLIGLTALFSLFNYLQGVQHGTLGANVVRDLRNTLYQKLQRLPFSWYTTMPTGQIMSRMLNDLDSIEQFVSFGFVLMIREAVTLALTLAICLYLDWQLTLLVMIPAPFLVFSITRFRKRIDPAWEAIREQMGKLTSVVQENVAGVRVVKAFARERFAMQRFGNENDVNRQKNVNRAKLEADYFPSADFFSSLSFVILVLVGSFRLMDGTLSFGIFFSFTWYIWSLIWPMRELGFFTNIMRQAAASAPRLFAIGDAREMSDGVDKGTGRQGDKENANRSLSPLPPVSLSRSGRIEFDSVHFAFPDDPNTPVLSGVSFVIEPGQTVAILGGTGSGKSSVINLVPRFYDVTDGRVLVDGVDVRDLPLKDLRLKMSLVPQETFLFSASLKENVAFGKPDASLEDVVAASKVAQVDEFAQKLPKGYDTKVGERGVGLSGGQKQRVALARAVLMNPAILILDEATSAVDTATEAVIQDAMAQVMRGRTSLVVAQRLSTVRNADKIIVLADGRVVQEGSHEQLYAVAGPYRELYDLQFKDQETAHADELDEEMIGEAKQARVLA